MKTRCQLMTIGVILLALALPAARVLAEPARMPPFQEETSTPEPSIPSPAEVIDAVNMLRLQHGLNVLIANDVLMQVAAEQVSALAASEGAIGHERPCGMTLGQQLLLMGFPLWGDLSMDGYRSENWGTARMAADAISMWLGDDLHTNTMLSPNRSDIGAAVAVDINGQIYIVLETALSTPGRKHQNTAYDILTSIPMTQAACMGWTTPGSGYVDLSQYSVPVALSTARPDGDVVHEVKYGQTLWSIAIEYGTTIEQLKRFNNLPDDTVVSGWKLLVQKGATQPAPPTPTFILSPQTLSATPTLTLTQPPTSTTPKPNEMSILTQSLGANKVVVAALIVSFSVLVAAVVGFGKKKEQ